MHITNKLFCNSQGGLGSYAIEGIQNATGTEGYAVPGRNNSGVWQTQNDAWRFDPDTVSAPSCIMSGRVFADFNGNCIVDGADYAVPGQTIIRDNGMAYTQTQANGIFSFEADTGNYIIGMNGLTANLPFATIVHLSIDLTEQKAPLSDKLSVLTILKTYFDCASFLTILIS